MTDTFEKARVYGNGTDSSIGKQLAPYYYYKKAMTDLKKEMYFGQLADTMTMPKM